MEVSLSYSDLDRFLRNNFTYDENGSASSSSYYEHSDYCTTSTGQEWVAILILFGLILGIVTSIVYLIVSVRHFDTLAANFPFLNNFLLASFMNLLSAGTFDIMSFISHCWYRGRVLCKIFPIVFDASENAMIFFIVATILQQNHPYVHSFLSKNAKFRKWTTITILWLTTMLFSIPEVIIWDVIELDGSSFFCGFKVSHNHHIKIYYHKGVFFEYLLPLLLLILTLIHASAVLSKRLGLLTSNSAPEESHSRNGENDLQEGTGSQCLQIRVTSVAIGLVFFVTKAPYYVAFFLYAFFTVSSNSLFTFGLIFYHIPSIVAPVLVLLTSPTHKKRLKETYQFIASCIAGRSVKKRLLLIAEDEDKLQDVRVELEHQ